MSPNPQNFPNTYLDPNITDAHLDTPIIRMVAVASPATTHEVFGTTVNHWRIFFVLSPDQSIVFDMVKRSGTDVKGVLGVLLKPYAVSFRTVKQVELPLISRDCTIRQAWGLLHSNGFLKYKYTAEGEGCRAWVANTVNCFENQGHYLRPGAVYQLWSIITQVWFDEFNCSPREMQSGNFYN